MIFFTIFLVIVFFQEIVWYPPPFYDWLSISCCLASRSKWFIPGSPLFNLFYSFVPGPVYWYPSQWNSTPSLDIHFWMSNPPPCWRVLFLEWPPPDWGHLLTSLFFLLFPFPFFPFPWLGAYSSSSSWNAWLGSYPLFSQGSHKLNSFNRSTSVFFTFFLRLWLLLFYRQRCFGDLGDNGLCVGIYGFYQFFQQSFL